MLLDAFKVAGSLALAGWRNDAGVHKAEDSVNGRQRHGLSLGFSQSRLERLDGHVLEAVERGENLGLKDGRRIVGIRSCATGRRALVLGEAVDYLAHTLDADCLHLVVFRCLLLESDAAVKRRHDNGFGLGVARLFEVLNESVLETNHGRQ